MTTPETVAAALAEYRALLDAHGPTWGEDPILYVKQMTTSAFLTGAELWEAMSAKIAEPGPEGGRLRPIDCDMDEMVRDALGGRVLDNLAALRLTDAGHAFQARAQAVLNGAEFRGTLLIDSARDTVVAVEVDGTRLEIAPRGARLVPITSASEVRVAGERVELTGLTRSALPARLRLRAGFPCRWTVMGEDGQGWYPEGAPPKRDHHGLPYFHGDDLVLDVPAELLTVRVTRGMEYGTAETTVIPAGETVVELTPERIYDAAARGWYGGDMHVHMNWAGDMVGEPALAAAMQHGEDLHVLNLVAGNVSAERVYDREALDHWAGRDLPWSDGTHIARMGVEYRNDLLGHFSVFGVPEPPGRYHTGFLKTVDWPPNGAAAAEFRARGGVVGYGHPFHPPAPGEDDPPGALIGHGRDCDAKEIVADAALGLVDSLDVLNHSSVAATALVYRRLVGAGNRLAVTAGTDGQMSFTRRGNQSAPPGWARVYAKVDGPLSAGSYAEALRRGRTFATTGPWLELAVAAGGGETGGPGETLDLAPGGTVTITARVVGPEAERLELRTADGLLAETSIRPGHTGTELTAELVVTEPTYVMAVVTGGPHPRTMRDDTYACTTPVHLDVAGRHVARPQDVRWCLDWLDLLEAVVRERGTFTSEDQLADHLALYDRARAVYRSRLPG
ncbi:CehA/McbA family metallohydrolase [Microtetraspora sp. NBRC 13810]|uniref:CehA/McbA family metallohydrolase n=1 Tax=Microtetraspora sp. NBRC 13810 TaxID=3030990 RepID=UPI0025530352|nr:CehA/McbA family metallohydrolase [Microtetraspora sp. NBRC 13810]